MTIVASIPSAAYPAGDRAFGPADIPLGVTAIQAVFTRQAWPGTNQDVVLQCGIECSLDGGLTWPIGAYNYDPDSGNGGWIGGARVSRGVTVASESIMRGDIPEPNNPNRKVRAMVKVKQALQTAVTLSVF
jgi:hypothetical protein